MEHIHTFGQWLRREREQRSWTRREFADQVSCSVSLITKLERDEQPPSKAMAERILNVLQVDAGQHERLLRLARFGPHDPGPATTLDGFSPRWDVPTPPTAFYGREQELQNLTQRLEDQQVRIVSLIGPGGVGKSRLALELGHALRPAFPDGIFWLSFIGLDNAKLVCPTILQRVAGQRQLSHSSADEQLIRMLRNKRCLLILDNMDHLIASGNEIGHVLNYTDGLSILVTSRRPLQLYGEQVYQVQPLPLPREHSTSTTAELAQVPSLALFLDRGRAISSSLELNEANRAAITAICAASDGLPLALEIAAANLRLHTLDQLVERVQQQRLDLSPHWTNTPMRHRSLRQMLDWSFELLTPTLADLCAQLSIFAGAFTPSDVQAVCPAAADSLEAVQNQLITLVEASLLTRSELIVGGQPTFALLPIIREYAAEQCTVDLRSAYSDYISAQIRRQPPATLGTQPHLKPHIHACLQWLDEQQASPALVELIIAMAGVWFNWGDLHEGIMWFEHCIKQQIALTPAQEARLYHRYGMFLTKLGQHSSAIAAYAVSLAAYAALQQPANQAQVLTFLAWIARQQHQLEQALAYVDQAEQLAEPSWTSRMIQLWTLRATLLCDQARFEEGIALFTRCVDCAREHELLGEISVSLGNLGYAYFCIGNTLRAQRYYKECLHVQAQQQDLMGQAYQRTNLAELYAISGNIARARAQLDKAQRLIKDTPVASVINNIAYNTLYIELSQENWEGAQSAAQRLLQLSELTDDVQMRAAAWLGMAVLGVHLQQWSASATLVHAAQANLYPGSYVGWLRRYAAYVQQALSSHAPGPAAPPSEQACEQALSTIIHALHIQAGSKHTKSRQRYRA